MGSILSSEEEQPTEHAVIIEERGKLIMQTLCNAIETNPQSDHVDRLVREYQECSIQMPMETVERLRKTLLEVLNGQINIIMMKEQWDEDRLRYLKEWVDRITLPQLAMNDGGE